VEASSQFRLLPARSQGMLQVWSGCGVCAADFLTVHDFAELW
jgi:hypothetical protein